MAVGKTDCMTFQLQVLATARTCINLGRGISSSVNKYLKKALDPKVSRAAAPQDLPRTCGAVSNVF